MSDENEIQQLVTDQTAALTRLSAAVTDLQTRLAPVLAIGLPPEFPQPLPDPEDSPISAALKLNNHSIFANEMFVRDMIARLEL